MLYDDIAQNKRNTAFLFIFFFVVISGLGYIIGELYGDYYLGIGVALVISGISMYTSYFHSDSLVLMMTGARPAERGMHLTYINAVEGLALAAGIPVPRAYVLDNPGINAFATGRDPKHAVIAVTEGALKKLDKQELEAVVAHEMCHIKNYDILVGSASAVLVGTVIIVTDFMKRSMFRSRGIRRGSSGTLMLVLAIAAAILAPIITMIIHYAVSRQREYLADANGVLLTRYPQGLINALVKIKKEAYGEEEVNRGLQHLYFHTPGYSELDSPFATHPPLDKRIERLGTMLYNQQQGLGNRG